MHKLLQCNTSYNKHTLILSVAIWLKQFWVWIVHLLDRQTSDDDAPTQRRKSTETPAALPLVDPAVGRRVGDPNTPSGPSAACSRLADDPFQMFIETRVAASVETRATDIRALAVPGVGTDAVCLASDAASRGQKAPKAYERLLEGLCSDSGGTGIPGRSVLAKMTGCSSHT